MLNNAIFSIFSVKYRIILAANGYVRNLADKARCLMSVFAIVSMLLSGAFPSLALAQEANNFQKGVLAVNTDKSTYFPEENVYLQMASLDNTGHTLCDSNLKLEIVDPYQNVTEFYTQNNSILKSSSCGDDNVTDLPDYFTNFTAKIPGTYYARVINLLNNNSTLNAFEVKEFLPYQVKRTGATRINPFKSGYVQTIIVTAQEDFSGQVYETLPEDFLVTDSGNGNIEKFTDNQGRAFQHIIWQTNIKAGESLDLKYEYMAPKISPEFFSLGPVLLQRITIQEIINQSKNNFQGEVVFAEKRAWQIASDGLCFSKATGNWNATTTWGGSCTGTGSLPGSGDTVVIGGDRTVTVNVATAVAATLFVASSSAAGTLTFSANSKITVSGDTWVGSSTRAATLTMTSGGTLTTRNLYAAGTAAKTLTAGQGEIEITGTQTLNVFKTFNKLTINGGTVTNGTSTLTVGTLGVTSGTFNTDALNVTVNTSTIATGTFAINGAGTFSLGNITVNSGGVFNNSSNANVTVTGNVSVDSNGTFTSGTGTYTMSGSTKTISGTLTFLNLTVSGTVTNNNTTTVTNVLSGTGTFTQGTGAFLDLYATSTIGALTASAANNTIRYASTSSMTIRPMTYYHLKLDPSGPGTPTYILGTTTGQTITVSGTTTIGSSNSVIVRGDIFDPTLTLSGDFTVNSGSTFFVPDAKAFTVSGTFTNAGNFYGDTSSSMQANRYLQTGGIATSTSGTFKILNYANDGTASSVIFSGGVFNHNNGLFRVDGWSNYISPATTTFYDLEVNLSGNCASNMYFHGTTTVAHNFYLPCGQALYGGVVEVKGDIIATRVLAGFGGSTEVVVNGTSTQNIVGASTGGSLPARLTINKTSGTLYFFERIDIYSMTGGYTEFNYIQGTVDAGTSTVAFRGVNATIIPGTIVFNNVHMDAGSNCATTQTTSGTTTVAGYLYFKCGIINGGVIAVAGNVSLGSSATGGSSVITLYGSGNQTLNSSGTMPTGLFNIAKSSGTTTLASNVTFRGALTIASGAFDQGASYNATTSGVLTVKSGATYYNVGTGDLGLGGNVVVDGSMILDSSGGGCGDADLILIRSTTAGTQRSWSGASTNLAFNDLDVKDQAGTAAITVYSGTSTANNGANWTFSATCSQGVFCTGTVYGSDETTALTGTSYNIKLAVGGSVVYSSTTVSSNGAFSINATSVPAVGSIMTIWLDNTSDPSIQGSLVFKYGESCTGYPGCTGLSLYVGRVTIDNKHTGSMAISNLTDCNNNSGSACSDTDIGFIAATSPVASTTLTFSSNILKIPGGVIFAPGGNVNAQKLSVAGIYTGGSETIVLSGTGTSGTCTDVGQTPLCVSGTFTPNSNTITYTASAGYSLFSTTYNNLNIQPTAAGSPNVTLTGGTLAVNGNLILGDGTNPVFVTATTSSPTVTVAGNFTNSTSSTFTATTTNINIGGNFTNTGTFTHGNGTVTMTAASGTKTISGTTTFYNLVINSDITVAFDISPATTTIVNNLTVTAGTLQGTGPVIVQGGTVSGNGTINLTGGTFTLNGAGNFGGSTAWTFSNLTLGASASTTASGTGGITVSGIFTNSGSLDAGNKTWTLSGSGAPFVNSGTLIPNLSTFSYTGTSNATITNTTYYNLSLAPAGTPTYTIGNPASDGSWYNSSWNYRKAITIDKTKVSTASGTTLTDFPVLVSIVGDANLKYTASGGYVASSTGGDLLFTSSNGTTLLNYEIEKYASTTGELIAWVKVPTISTTSDTTLFLYYGNASATNQATSTGVWDSDFKGVWHLPNGSSLTADDSSVNGNDSTTITATATSGKFDGAAAFNATQRIKLPNIPLTTAFTLEAWIKPSAYVNSARIIAKAYTSNIAPWVSYSLAMGSVASQGLNLAVNIGGSGYSLNSIGTVSLNTWAHVVGIYDGSYLTLYINGVASGSVAQTGTLSTVSQVTEIGYNTVWSPQSFNGVIDEVRISAISRSVDWIATEYNNQSSTSTFYSVGSQQAAGSTQMTVSNNLTVGNGANAVVVVAPTGSVAVSGNVNISSGTLNLNTNNTTLNVSGNVIISGTLSAATSSLLTLQNNWTNNGTFTHNNGTVVINPVSASVINGSQVTNFYNLYSTASGKVISFKNGQQLGVSGLLTLLGISGRPINISSDSAGQQWLLNLTGTSNVNYIRVQDSACVAGTIAPSDGISDGGNNSSCWGLVIRGGTQIILRFEGVSGGGTPVTGGDQGGGITPVETPGGGGTPQTGGGQGGGGGAAP